jgi:hypothetical protein
MRRCLSPLTNVSNALRAIPTSVTITASFSLAIVWASFAFYGGIWDSFSGFYKILHSCTRLCYADKVFFNLLSVFENAKASVADKYLGKHPLLALFNMSVLDQFLSDITSSLRNKNGSRIAELIHLDVERLPPERQKPYVELNQQLKAQFPRSQDGRLDGRLLERCRAAVPQDEFGSFSTSFSESIVRYFRYLRDVDTADNLSKAGEIRQLTR